MKLTLFATAFALVSLAVSSVDARFGQEEKSPFIKKLEHFMSGDIGGCLADLSGTAIDSLLIAAPPCSMQDQMDKVIDIAKFLGGSRKNKLIDIAKHLAAAEKNTPNNGQRSVPCNKRPRNRELNGIKPKQDPTNGPGRRMPPFKPRKFKPVKNFTCKFIHRRSSIKRSVQQKMRRSTLFA